MPNVPVAAPGGFAPVAAVSFGTQDGPATPVDASHPLPVRQALGASGVAALAGMASASGTFGSFAPVLGRAIVVTLAGTWTGKVQVLRSIDGGASKLPLTFIDGSERAAWTGNVNSAIGEETVAGATYYLAATLTAGSLSYRMEQ